MARALHLLDRWIDFLVVAALVFTPLAFGAVEEWARATGQITIWVLFAAWLCKLLWTPHNPSRVVGGRRFGGRVRFSGLELPALAFVAVLLLQLVPLPPALIGTISPKTNEIFEASLPGYGRPDPTFSGMPAWLAREPASPDEIRGFPADPESASSAFPAEWFGVEHRPWRP
ncbi:MAG: hypothetical protein GTO30_20995, partial [Acidobacteria bacterium]|nr:hypothetical protein [Acidobacteriota bacterium]NIM64032.1 hypothetical protein [Acidobacteriota bacterium]NIQ85349.1 hypothetical protein [Acidobacteriota bacterium]NIT11096.1 hypothetical protein [Acidobacteriota bacterium]